MYHVDLVVIVCATLGGAVVEVGSKWNVVMPEVLLDEWYGTLYFGWSFYFRMKSDVFLPFAKFPSDGFGWHEHSITSIHNVTILIDFIIQIENGYGYYKL